MKLDFGGLVEKKSKPSDLDMIYYVFMSHGIGLDRLEEYPIPYVLAMVNTHSWVVEQENKVGEKK